MCIDYFQQGFTNFATIFEPYKKYCAEQVLCQNYCKDLNRNDALFTAYLAWCESQKECNRLVLVIKTLIESLLFHLIENLVHA
jgi:pleckstrin homology domain-containing family G member 5